MTMTFACRRSRMLNLGIAVALGMVLLWYPTPGSAQGSAAKSVLAGKLVITGSSTMAPLVSEIAQRFTKLHPGVEVEVRSGGSGKGISDLHAGASSIAMASRPLLDAERDLFAVPIARDGARQRAEAIREGVARLEVKAGDRVLEPVTLSLGVALFPEDATTIASVLAAADAALYQAKRQGRNRVVMSAAPGTSDVTAQIGRAHV